jgi:AbrB family looped-hinge helix DNA binding protein
MNAITVKVDASGRLVIPKDLREAMGVADGGTLVLRVEDGELRAQTRMAALRRIQAEMAQLVPPGVSAVDELLASRRAEAARELGAQQADPDARAAVRDG